MEEEYTHWDSSILNIIISDRKLKNLSFLTNHLPGDIIITGNYDSWNPQRIARDLWIEKIGPYRSNYFRIRVFAFYHGDQVARELNTLTRNFLGLKLEIYAIAPIFDSRCLNFAWPTDRIKIWLWQLFRKDTDDHKYAQAVILPQNSRICSIWQTIYYLTNVFTERQLGYKGAKRIFYTSYDHMISYVEILHKIGALATALSYHVIS
ncbi:hypothetical protein IJH97_02800 [Candidatus Saccharibacteria bacterium]|nr:hypothetical protein [Candidatus Saccharibacteria bacterium]